MATRLGAGCERRGQGAQATVQAAEGEPALPLAVDRHPPPTVGFGRQGDDPGHVLLEERRAALQAVQAEPKRLAVGQGPGEHDQRQAQRRERRSQPEASAAQDGEEASRADHRPQRAGRPQRRRGAPGRPARLPATHPTMFAHCKTPTLKPLVRRSSWTARCKSVNDSPMSSVGMPKRRIGKPP